MDTKQLIARLIVASTLIAVSHNVHAIGDSTAGCSVDSQLARVLSFGSVADVDSYVSSKLSRSTASTKHITKKAILDGKMNCSSDFPLDYAVGSGNVDVVRWLLDLGVDPSATSAGAKDDVFTRCKSFPNGTPAGISKEQSSKRLLEAYQLLIARGADINALDPFRSIYGCRNNEMLPLLRQLGAQVTRKAFQSRVRSVRQGRTIGESEWAVVAQMAKWQAFDFRGTSFEAGLLSMLEGRSNMDDYDAVVELTRRLGTIVRLSPGIVPGQPARPMDVPGRFSPVRERCYFPEIGAYPNFEFRALWRDAPPDQPFSRVPDETEVKVGRTKAPVLLALMNNRDAPTTWRISRTSDAHVLGVIVLDTIRGLGKKDALSFDPLRPAVLGVGHGCAVLVLTRADGYAKNELRPYTPANPESRSYDPFQLRGEPAIDVSQGNQFSVGEIPPSAKMISWPDSRREKAPVRRE